MRLLPRLTRQPRTTEETTVPDTTIDTHTSTEVIMRFLTQGGAVVELYPHQWAELQVRNKERIWVDCTGFEWRCTGCDMTGNRKRLKLSDIGYQEREPRDSRTDANFHADSCRAMPRP